jgi:hypothetical protein
MSFIDYPISDKCKHPFDTYGTCLQCNDCGAFGPRNPEEAIITEIVEQARKAESLLCLPFHDPQIQNGGDRATKKALGVALAAWDDLQARGRK